MAAEHTPTAFQFTEKMRGYVTFDETNFEDGYQRGTEDGTKLMFQLTIRTEDVDRFVDDADHEADATGYVQCDHLGGRRPVEKGIFNLFVDSDDQNKRKMLYRPRSRTSTLPGHFLLRRHAQIAPPNPVPMTTAS